MNGDKENQKPQTKTINKTMQYQHLNQNQRCRMHDERDGDSIKNHPLRQITARSFLFFVTFATALFSGNQTARAQNSNYTFNPIVTGNHILQAWKSSDYQAPSWGYFERKWTGDVNYLSVAPYASAGGTDAGVGKNVASGKLVNSISSGQYCSVTVENKLAPDGPSNAFWWSGPKTLVYYRPTWDPVKQLTDQYECYIVEDSNVPSASFYTRIPNISRAYRGTTYFDGSNYDHYTNRTSDNINQIYYIRQNYRKTGGGSSVGAIMREWVSRGYCPNWYCLGWKYNIETYGRTYGYIVFSYINMPWN
jgi:hypothetical protein